MTNLSYWQARQVQNMYHYMQSAEETADEITKLYLKASRWMSLEADEIFERFQTKHNLSESEARQLLNTLQDRTSLDEMLNRLKSGDAKGERKELIAKLEAPAYAARIEHLKQLQNQLDYVMKNVYEQEKTISTSHYIDFANEAYYRTIYDMQQRTQAAFSFNHIDQKTIDRVLHSKWSGENYSSRIWKNTRTLSQNIKEELLINLVTGRTNREVADIIANKYAQGASNARRLVRTESAYLSAELNFEAYRDMDIEEYQLLATLDLRTSETCRALDLEIYKVSDRKIGLNCPPMHPWCRSTTVPIVDRKYLEGKQRAAIDPATGKRILVPRDMTYEEWHAKYVKDKPDAELNEKKVKNLSSDRKQHERYRQVLGDEIPEKLDDFQKMKYTDGDRWNELKADFRIVNQYNIVAGNISTKQIIELHQKWMESKKEFSGKYKKSGNVAYAKFGSEEVVAHSKARSATNEAFVKYKGVKEIALLKEDRAFKTEIIKGYDRKLDCEAKIFEHIHAKYGNRKATLYLNSGYTMCDSCKGVLEQYHSKNPNVDICVIERKGNQDG